MDILKIRDYSWMSQASYLGLDDVVEGNVDSLKSQLAFDSYNVDNKFSNEQANIFVNAGTGYAFVNHLKNTASGFSASVFSSNESSEYTIAVRGTEPILDQFGEDLLSADGFGVVLSGQAIEQLIDAYRYYKQLTSTPSSDIYSEAEISKLVQLYAQTPEVIFSGSGIEGKIILFENELREDSGLDKIPAGNTINFTGHSLGGHVAALLAEMIAQFEGAGNIGDIVTYNAPGFDALTYEVQNWLGIDTTIQSGILGDKHLAIIGEGGLEVTAGLGQVNGTKQLVFIEKEDVDISIGNHSIVKLSDSLAVYNLFSILDTSFDSNLEGLTKVKDIFDAATNNPDQSLETILDKIGNLFGVSGELAIGDRDAIYTRIEEVQGSLLFQSVAGFTSIVAVGNLSNASTEDTVDGYAYRYALVNLNPFAITGNEGLYVPEEWSADYFSDKYLQDRAYFLSQLTQLNIFDARTVPGNLTWEHYKDLQVDIQFSAHDFGLEIPLSAIRYVFGGQSNDTITAGNQADHLYGGAGNDSINGGEGADYIEGNADDDNLAGGAGDDIILGGTGVDVISGDDNEDYLYGGAGDDVINGGSHTDHLYGEAGNDTLIGGGATDILDGGEGFDTYVFNSGDGSDVVIDSDGLGKIIYDSIELTGGEEIAPNTYKSADGLFTYILSTKPDSSLWLQIVGPAGVVSVDNFTDGALGLNFTQSSDSFDGEATVTTFINSNDTLRINGNTVLNETAELPGAPDPDSPGYIEFTTNIDAVYAGDGADAIYVSDVAFNPGIHLYGGEGNDLLKFTVPHDESVAQAGSEGAYLYGEGGNDNMGGSSLDDWMDGGLGHDLLSDHKGKDLLHGMEGNDLIFSGDDQDNVFGGEGNDWLYGGANADILSGGSGDDKLFGDTERGKLHVEALDKSFQTFGSWNGENEKVEFYEASLWWELPSEIASIDLAQASDVALTDVGNDILSGDDGDDNMYGGGGNDYLYGGRDNDQLYGEAGDDELYGGEGNDEIWGDKLSAQFVSDTTPVFADHSDALDLTVNAVFREHQDSVDVIGNDILDGGTGTDRLYGGGGNDELNGGAGNDWLKGGEGDDTYRIDANWGVDNITDEEGVDVIRFGAGINADDLNVSRLENGLVIWDQANNQVQIKDWFSNSASRIEEVRFANGTVWTSADLTEAALHQVGSDGNDNLHGYDDEQNHLDGGAGNDQLFGGSLNDLLEGGIGDDTLIGNGGDDLLEGGAGDDSYLIGGSAGATTLRDDSSEGAVNTVRFAAGMLTSDLTPTRVGDDLNLSWNGGIGAATIEGYYADPGAWRFELASGTVVQADKIMNPQQSAGLLVDVEMERHREAEFAALSAEAGGPGPVEGQIRVSVQHGSGPIDMPTDETFESLQISSGGELMTYIENTSLGVQGFHYLFLDDILQKTETVVDVENIQGTDAADIIHPTSGTEYDSHNQIAYVTFGAVVSQEGSSFTADISGTAYERPDFVPDNKLQSVGDTYQGILRADITVLSHTNRFSIIDAGAGDDFVGYEISVTPGSIAATYKDGSIFSDTYHNGPLNIDGGQGSDELFGGRQNDFLYGGEDNDDLYGYGGDDVLAGGEGEDYLFGHGGADTYLVDFNGISKDIVIDNGLFTEGDVVGLLVEERGLSSEQAVELVRNSDESLIAELQAEFPEAFPNVDDTVRFDAALSDVSMEWIAPDDEGRVGIAITSLVNPDSFVVMKLRGPNDFVGFGVESFQFSDISLSHAELIGNMPEQPSSWPIVGTEVYDEIFGTGGDDILVGKGDYDDLSGGEGNDVYLYNAGDGSDYIFDLSEIAGESGIDTLSLGMGVQPEDIKASLLFEDYGGGETYSLLLLEFGNSGESLEIEWDFTYSDGETIISEPAHIENVQFLDVDGGQVFDLLGIVTSQQNELIDAYDQGVSIPLFNADALNNFDITSAAGLAGGVFAYNYATTGDVHTAPEQPSINEITGGADSETLVGTDLADLINAGGGNDLVDARAGNDFIIGGLGNDILNGGAGEDTFSMTGWEGYDQIDGGEGNDTIVGSDADDEIGVTTFSGDNTVELIDAGSGYDTILNDGADSVLDFSNTTLLGVDLIDGRSGNDTITGSAVSDTITGGYGDDTLGGGAGDDLFIVSGYGGNDRYSGGEGIDTIFGSSAADTIGISSFTGADTVEVIDGGDGYDIIANNQVNGVLDFSNTTLIGIEAIEGRGGNDTITGSAGNDSIIGGSGDDVLVGGSGDDILVGGAGNDSITGSIGNDTITGSAGLDTIEGGYGDDSLSGGADDDLFVVNGYGGSDLYNGGGGIDTILGSSAADTIGISSFTGADTVDIIDGGEGYDIITNNQASGVLDFSNTTLIGIEAIEGRSGDDAITGSSGDDYIIGGYGDDVLVGGNGNDTLKGGADDDTFVVSGWAGYDQVNGGGGVDTLLGTASDDQIGLSTFTAANRVEVIDGGAGNNTIVNDSASSVLDFSNTSLIGIDLINGRGGHDTITGSAGNDAIMGGYGHDILDGSSGDDVLTGNFGNDTYIVSRGSGSDVVNDYDVQEAQSDTNEDTVLFGANIASDQLWFSHTGDDLHISIIGTDDSVAISDWYSGDAYRAERFELSDGTYLLETQVQQLVNAMAAFSPPAFGDTTLTPELEQELNPVITASWQSVA